MEQKNRQLHIWMFNARLRVPASSHTNEHRCVCVCARAEEHTWWHGERDKQTPLAVAMRTAL